jgi:outer membrane lipoprotein SlyB
MIHSRAFSALLTGLLATASWGASAQTLNGVPLSPTAPGATAPAVPAVPAVPVLSPAAPVLAAPSATPATPAAMLTPAQIKAQQDLSAAQVAADKANKDALDAQAKAKAAQDAVESKAAQDAAAIRAAQDQKAKAVQLAALCDTCGIVTGVRSEKRKGKGGALGIIGGVVGGGLLGSQVGKGDGKTLGTVGGAVGGAILGNEIQKRFGRTTVHITSIQLKDGSSRSYESETAPAWAVGNSVKLDSASNTVTKL